MRAPACTGSQDLHIPQIQATVRLPHGRYDSSSARWLQGSAESGPKIGKTPTRRVVHHDRIRGPECGAHRLGRAQLVTTGLVTTGLATTGLATTGLATTGPRPVEPRTT